MDPNVQENKEDAIWNEKVYEQLWEIVWPKQGTHKTIKDGKLYDQRGILLGVVGPPGPVGPVGAQETVGEKESKLRLRWQRLYDQTRGPVPDRNDYTRGLSDGELWKAVFHCKVSSQHPLHCYYAGQWVRHNLFYQCGPEISTEYFYDFACRLAEVDLQTCFARPSPKVTSLLNVTRLVVERMQVIHMPTEVSYGMQGIKILPLLKNEHDRIQQALPRALHALWGLLFEQKLEQLMPMILSFIMPTVDRQSMMDCISSPSLANISKELYPEWLSAILGTFPKPSPSRAEDADGAEDAEDADC